MHVRFEDSNAIWYNERMSFHEREIRVKAVPDIRQLPIPVVMDLMVPMVLPGIGRRDYETVALGLTRSVCNTADVQLFAEECSKQIESTDFEDPALEVLQMTGGVIIVEERQLFFAKIKTPWLRRSDIDPIHIPNFDERQHMYGLDGP
jgi:hypothetical protein